MFLMFLLQIITICYNTKHKIKQVTHSPRREATGGFHTYVELVCLMCLIFFITTKEHPTENIMTTH